MPNYNEHVSETAMASAELRYAWTTIHVAMMTAVQISSFFVEQEAALKVIMDHLCERECIYGFVGEDGTPYSPRLLEDIFKKAAERTPEKKLPMIMINTFFIGSSTGDPKKGLGYLVPRMPRLDEIEKIRDDKTMYVARHNRRKI